MWYCATSDRHDGPYSEDDIREFLANGLIDETTLVWRDGQADWLPLGRSELAPLLSASPSSGFGTPPPPPPPPGNSSSRSPFGPSSPGSGGRGHSGTGPGGPWGAGAADLPPGAGPWPAGEPDAGPDRSRPGADIPPRGDRAAGPPPRSSARRKREIAGVWRRILAYWIDGVVVSMLSFIALTVTFIVVGDGDNIIPQTPWQTGESIGGSAASTDIPSDDTNDSWRWLAVLGVPVLYHAFMLSSNWQATIGKRILGVYVARDDGGKLSFLHAVLRYLCTYISWAIAYIGYLMAFFTKHNKALHDIICGTRVELGRLDGDEDQ